MRRLFVGLMASSLMLSVGAAPAAAQKQALKTRGYFGVGVGATMPLGDFGDQAKTGWLLNAIGGVTLKNGFVGLRGDLMFARNSLKVIDGADRFIGFNADVVLTPGHRPSKVHPYALVGFGVYNVDNTAATGSSATKPAFNAGAGLQIHTGHRVDVFAEARFISIFFSGGHINLLPLTLGFRWGGI